MIASLEDVKAYAEERARKNPVVASRILMRSPGLNNEGRRRLRRELPGLPDSYVDCAERYSIGTVELGMAALRPRSFGGEDLVDRLVMANGPANPVFGFLQARGLYEVASWESDPIGVKGRGAPDEGEVFWVDISSGGDFIVSPLAPDFAAFMVMAARLWQGVHTGADIEEILQGVQLSPWQQEGWRSLGSMVLEP